MSRSRKHVEEHILTDNPEPREDEHIVRVTESFGRNTVEVTYPNGTSVLALIPSKFLNKIWMKKGGFVIIEPTRLPHASSKVVAVVNHILFPEHIQHLLKIKKWPAEFIDEVQNTFNFRTESSKLHSYADLELLSEDVAKKHRLRLFPAGSVLFAKSGMSATKGLVYRLTSPADRKSVV